MKVLIACEESQTECLAFRALGHEAYSCDIEDCSGNHPQFHIKSDALKILNGDCNFKTEDGTKRTIVGKWDLIIAHPPCTFLSNAGANSLFKDGKLNYERFVLGLEAKEFFMRFWLYGYYGCGKICIENPVPSSIYQLPLPTQTIEPYYFGEPYSKKTCLWEFGIPKLKPTEVLKEHAPYLECVKNDKKVRSKSFVKVALAMACQWSE